jgi:hypothetical protein
MSRKLAFIFLIEPIMSRKLANKFLIEPIMSRKLANYGMCFLKFIYFRVK